MRVLCKTQNETVVFESTNITFSADGYIYAKANDIRGGIVRFFAGGQNLDMAKMTLAKDGYIDVTNYLIEYLDDWNHRYVSEKELAQQSQPQEQPPKVEGEVVE